MRDTFFGRDTPMGEKVGRERWHAPNSLERFRSHFSERSLKGGPYFPLARKYFRRDDSHPLPRVPESEPAKSPELALPRQGHPETDLGCHLAIWRSGLSPGGPQRIAAKGCLASRIPQKSPALRLTTYSGSQFTGSRPKNRDALAMILGRYGSVPCLMVPCLG